MLLNSSTTGDAAGRQVSQTTFSDGLSQTTSNLFDTVGRTLASKDAAGLVTTYQYPDELTTVTIAPGGLRIGRTSCISGRGAEHLRVG